MAEERTHSRLFQLWPNVHATATFTTGLVFQQVWDRKWKDVTGTGSRSFRGKKKKKKVLRKPHVHSMLHVHSSNTHTHLLKHANTQPREHPQLFLTVRRVQSFRSCDLAALIQVQLHIIDYWKTQLTIWFTSLFWVIKTKFCFVLFFTFFALTGQEFKVSSSDKHGFPK